DGIKVLLYKLLFGKVMSLKFRILLKKERWEESIQTGERLLEIFPSNSYYVYKLAESYPKINNNKKAYKIIEEFRNLNFDLNEVVRLSQRHITLPSDCITSRYLYLGGNNNQGFIEHACKNDKYITKIIQSNHRKM